MKTPEELFAMKKKIDSISEQEKMIVEKNQEIYLRKLKELDTALRSVRSIFEQISPDKTQTIPLNTPSNICIRFDKYPAGRYVHKVIIQQRCYITNPEDYPSSKPDVLEVHNLILFNQEVSDYDVFAELALKRIEEILTEKLESSTKLLDKANAMNHNLSKMLGGKTNG